MVVSAASPSDGNLTRKRPPFGDRRVTGLVDRRPKPFPIESTDLLESVDQPGGVHPKSVQNDACNRVTHELQLLEALVVGVLPSTMPFGPDVLVPDFVGCQRLEFGCVQERDRWRRHQDHGARMQGNGRLREIDHLDLEPVAPGRREQPANLIHFPLRHGSEPGDLAFGRKGSQYRLHVFPGERCRPGGFQQLSKRRRVDQEQISWTRN